MENFWLCFVQLFVAVDAVGTLPLFLSLTEGIDPAKRRRIVAQSVLTALIVGIGFLFLGDSVLVFLGITVNDFLVAGGILLLVISISDTLSGEKRRRRVDQDSLGAVPIGVPLIVGPAVLTTSLLMLRQYGTLATVLSLVSNILIGGLVFLGSGLIIRALGKPGTRTVSKLAALLLAAIAVHMIRRGLAGTP